MNDQSNAIATRQPRTPVEALKLQVENKGEDFSKALGRSGIPLDKFRSTITTAALTNPKLLDCDRRSLLASAMKLAQDGLLPDGREAALVPFKNRQQINGSWQDVWLVQPMRMVYGLRKLIVQSGLVVSLEVGVVYRAELEGGNFIYEIGMEPPIRHRPKLDMTDEQIADDEIVAAYSIARIKSDTGGEPYWSVEVMRRAEINKVRQVSQTGAVGKTDRNGKPIPPKGPWVDWFAEMAKKTVMRRHSKVLPMSSDIMESVLRDDDEGYVRAAAAGVIEQEIESGATKLPSAAELAAAADDAGETVDNETGEITTDSRGMTEVDEETARALDAGDGDEDAEEGEESQEAADPEPASADPYAGEPFAEQRKRLVGLIQNAETRDELEYADKEVAKHYASFPDPVQSELDTAIIKKRRTL